MQRFQFRTATALLSITFGLGLLSSVARADGHATGNGGGVICVSGQCKTLTEAGLRMSPKFDGVWLPESDHYSGVKRELAWKLSWPLNAKSELEFRIFERADHFRKVDVIDPARLDAIKKQYMEAAAKANFPVDPSTFEIVAVSSDDTVKPAMTYLLPKFFHLTHVQQVSILIHEGLYRGRPSSDLRYILQLESSMGATRECNSSNNERQVCNDQRILGYRLNFIRKMDLIGLLLSSIQLSSELPIEWFGKFSGTASSASLVFDPKKLIGFGAIESRIPYMFSQISSLKLKFSREDDLCSTNRIGRLEVSRSTGAAEILRPAPRKVENCEIYLLDENQAIPLLLPE